MATMDVAVQRFVLHNHCAHLTYRNTNQHVNRRTGCTLVAFR